MENISLCIFRYLIKINASVFVIFFSTAFLRRGMAYKALKNQELAVEDFKSMLKIDPNNKRAKVIPYNSQVVNTGRALLVLSFIPISNLMSDLNISGFVGRNRKFKQAGGLENEEQRSAVKNRRNRKRR